MSRDIMRRASGSATDDDMNAPRLAVQAAGALRRGISSMRVHASSVRTYATSAQLEPVAPRAAKQPKVGGWWLTAHALGLSVPCDAQQAKRPKNVPIWQVQTPIA